MKPIRMLILLMVMWATGSLLFAADAPPPAAPAERPAAGAEPTQAGAAESGEAADANEEPTPAPAASTQEGEDQAPPAPSAADGKPSPQRFVPSEQVRADFDVSFPIDI